MTTNAGSRRRLVLGLFVAVLVLVPVGFMVVDARSDPVSPADEPNGAPAPRRPPRVSLFGDSLAYQARLGFIARMTEGSKAKLNVSTFPGQALCDYRAAIIDDLLRNRPQILMLEFSGNAFTDCTRDAAGELLRIGSPEWRVRYLDDLRAVLSIAVATGTKVIWATAPPVHHRAQLDDYPRLIAADARNLSKTVPWLRVVSTGRALTTPDGLFAWSLPCRSDEQAVCQDGRTTVRSDDGLHFDCTGTPDQFGGCAGYSAGGRRYGEAMADAVLAALANEGFSSSPGSRP